MTPPARLAPLIARDEFAPDGFARDEFARERLRGIYRARAGWVG